MLKVGDWVECDNGYGVITSIVPRYYQYWDDHIPDSKKPGEFKQNTVIVKRFCNFDFKISMQTRMLSEKITSKADKKDMAIINKLLEDDKNAEKFNKYKVKADFVEVLNWNQTLSDEKIDSIRNSLSELKDNGVLRMTMKDMESYFQNEFGVELIRKSKEKANCYIQLLSAGLGVYKDKEMLFKEVSIQKI